MRRYRCHGWREPTWPNSELSNSRHWSLAMARLCCVRSIIDTSRRFNQISCHSDRWRVTARPLLAVQIAAPSRAIANSLVISYWNIR